MSNTKPPKHALLDVIGREKPATAAALLDRGADVEAKDSNGWPVLMLAEWRSETSEIMDRLRASIAAARAQDMSSPDSLLIAALLGDQVRVNKLLMAGFAADRREADGPTALMGAALMGNEGIVEVLLTNGADVNATDPQGITPLMCAVRHGYDAVVQRFISAGADVHARDHRGQTALIWASRGAVDIATIEALIHAGVDVNICARGSVTAWRWAVLKGATAAADLLARAGARE